MNAGGVGIGISRIPTITVRVRAGVGSVSDIIVSEAPELLMLQLKTVSESG